MGGSLERATFRACAVLTPRGRGALDRLAQGLLTDMRPRAQGKASPYSHGCVFKGEQYSSEVPSYGFHQSNEVPQCIF